MAIYCGAAVMVLTAMHIAAPSSIIGGTVFKQGPYALFYKQSKRWYTQL